MGRYKDAAKENQTNKEVFNIQSRLDIADMLTELDIQNQEPNEPSTWVLSPKHRRILIAVLSKLVCILFALNLHAQNKGVLVLPQGEGQGDSLGNVIPDTEILIGQGTNLATSTDSLIWDAGFQVIGPVSFTALTKGITPSGTDSLLQITSAGVVFKQPKVADTDTHIGNTNLTLTANRTLTGAGFDLTITGIDEFIVNNGLNIFGVSSTGIAFSAGGPGDAITFTSDANTQFISGADVLMSVLDDVDISTGDDLIFDAPDIILEDPLALDSNADTVLVRNNVTGEIMGRLVSSILTPAGSTGEVQINNAGAFGASSGLIWNTTDVRLDVDGTAGTSSIMLQNGEYLGGKNSGGTARRVFGISASNHVYLGAIDDVGGKTIIREDGADKLTIDGSNFGFNTTTFGTSAVGVLAIGNGTAPSTSIANGVQLWAEDVSSSSELRVRDEGGTVTTLSPHNFSLIGEKSHEMAWSHYSEKGEYKINVDMFKLAVLVEKLTGEKLIYLSSGGEMISLPHQHIEKIVTRNRKKSTYKK